LLQASDGLPKIVEGFHKQRLLENGLNQIMYLRQRNSGGKRSEFPGDVIRSDLKNLRVGLPERSSPLKFEPHLLDLAVLQANSLSGSTSQPVLLSLSVILKFLFNISFSLLNSIPWRV
jgi:hypothetical protein